MSDSKKSGSISWTEGGGEGFGKYLEKDDYLHPEATIPGDTLTETWAYQWYIPEHDISSIVYLWVHPNLNVVTAGLTVWQGHKNSNLSAELFDVHAYMSASTIGDGRDMKFPNGLHVEILEPLKRMRIRYNGATADANQNNLDLLVEAASPPVMRESCKHFEQVTKCTGQLLLRGQQYEVNDYGLRDRSWGELRPEDSMTIPPYTYMTGTFPDTGWSWTACAHDDPKLNPEWAERYDIDPEQTLLDAWIYRDDELLRLTDFSKITTRDPNTLRPVSHQIRMTDSKGRSYEITGEITASLPWTGWPNAVTNICLTRWEWNGETGWGDTQEVQWNDFVWAHRKDQSRFS